MADDDAVRGPEAAAHLGGAALYLNEILAHRTARLHRGGQAGWKGSGRMGANLLQTDGGRRHRRRSGGRLAPSLQQRTSSIFSSINLTIGLLVVALSTMFAACSALVPGHCCRWLSCGCCCCVSMTYKRFSSNDGGGERDSVLLSSRHRQRCRHHRFAAIASSNLAPFSRP